MIFVGLNRKFFQVLAEGARGGLFRNSGGKVLVQFRKEIVVDLAVYVNLLSLREGILMAAASRWASFLSFPIESDS